MPPENISLSKGCFIYKNAEAQTSGNAKKLSVKGESKSWKLRKELYKTTWTKIESEIKAIQEKAHQNIIDAITEFVIARTSSPYIFEIPTCAVVLGINSPDHSSFFKLLSEKLESATEHVVILNSKDCSNIGNMVQHAVKMIINSGRNNSEATSNILKHNCTFANLLNWYERKYMSQATFSPRKKIKTTKSSAKNPPLLVILEDFEAFSSSVLQDFILLCNSYLSKLPLVLVFGVATAMTTVHDRLTQKAALCLGVESFYSFSPLEYLSQILQVIMEPDLPFKLGGKVYRLLIDTVLFHDFSVSNLKHMLKFCLFEHYYENKSSVFCCESRLLPLTMKKVLQSDLKEVKRLPSFERYLNNLEDKEKKLLLTREQEYQKIIIKLLSDLHKHAKESNILIYCLHKLSQDLPSKHFGKQIRELYQLLLEKNICDTEEFETTFKLLSMLSKGELEERLKQFLLALENHTNGTEMEAYSEIRENMQNFLQQLENLPQKSTNGIQNRKLDSSYWGKMTSRSQFKERLQMLTTQKKSNLYEECRLDVIAYLKSIFKTLKSPSDLPLNEVLYFDDVVALREHIMASPRAALRNALMNPHSYLKCSCCRLHHLEEITSALPDLSIAYKLQLENGRTINLYDWFQEFSSVIETSEPRMKKQNANKKKEKESIQLARFMKSVAEMQLLGFIKPSKRKSNFVQKLTWEY